MSTVAGYGRLRIQRDPRCLPIPKHLRHDLQLPDRGGTTEVVALPEANAETLDGLCFGERLDALGDDEGAGHCGKLNEAGDHGLPGHVEVDTSHEADVDLDNVRPQVDEMSEVGDSGTGVVGRDSHVGAEGTHRDMQRPVIVDDLVLGDLQDDRPRLTGKELRQNPAAAEEVGRDIEAQPSVGRKARAGSDRATEGRGLEFDAEADPYGVDERLCRRVVGGEPGERLEADRLARCEVDDRLEDRPERAGLDHRRHRCALPPELLPRQQLRGEDLLGKRC
jgi:hypothetical protein